MENFDGHEILITVRLQVGVDDGEDVSEKEVNEAARHAIDNAVRQIESMGFSHPLEKVCFEVKDVYLSHKEEGQVIALIGNLTEGFSAKGPYSSFDEAFDEACIQNNQAESWIMTLNEKT